MHHEYTRTGFVGGGRVARVLVGGWRHAGKLPPTVLVNEPDDAAFGRLAALCPEVRRSPLEEAAASDVVFLGLHPPALAPALPGVRSSLGQQTIVVSLAPKIPLSVLGPGLGTTRVVRMIPNAPSIIGRGYNPIALGSDIDATARQALLVLFAPWGACPEVDECDLEAYAVLTGMGPTYFWFQWQALRDVAGQMGMSGDRADDALQSMLGGALATLFQSGLPAADVMDLIPVRPLEALEATVTAAYREVLPALFARIRPAG